MYLPVLVESVGKVVSHVNGECVLTVGNPASPRYGERTGVSYLTDDEYAAHSMRCSRNRQDAFIRESLNTASLETLNQIAALLGLPVVAAWTPEQT